jgi:6-phosphogluconolactonase
MKTFDLAQFGSDAELARAAAGAWLEEIATADRAAAPHYVALSGGRIASGFFAAAVDQARARGISFAGVHFFWADERCVPPDDAQSNYREARERLLVPLGIPQNRIHRIRGESGPESAAAEATGEIRRVVPGGEDGQPLLDLVLLGMGEDGHVASLFPVEPEPTRSRGEVYRAVTNSPKPPPNRVTLNYAALAAARQVWVLVAGAGKASALRDSLAVGGRTPLARVLELRRGVKVFSAVGRI